MSGARHHLPDDIEVEARPRPGGPPRLIARLSARDARAWHAIAGSVVPGLENRLGPEVVANRALGAGRRWRLEGLGASLGRLRRMIRPLTGAAARGALLVSTDVRDFFPSVSPEAVARALLNAGATPEDAAKAATMLEGWGSLGYRGLPIGPRASAVLANAVLRPVDRAVDAPFVRWVDDYLAVVDDERHAAEVLDRMDEALARLGLSRSDRKTRVGPDVSWLGSALGGSGRSGAAHA
jgi:Reverse transcriptase (RNA-dependent DNA polymerase)